MAAFMKRRQRSRQAGDAAPTTNPDSACPTCGATGDDPCRTKAGVATTDHKRRPD